MCGAHECAVLIARERVGLACVCFRLRVHACPAWPVSAPRDSLALFWLVVFDQDAAVAEPGVTAEELGQRKNASLEKQIAAANAKIKELEEKRRVLNGKIAKKEKEAEEAEVSEAMAQVRPGMEHAESEEEDNEKWEAEEDAAPAPAPAPAKAEAEAEALPEAAADVPEDCKNPELYAFLASDSVQMVNLYQSFVEGGISSVADLKDIESVEEFVEDFGLKKAQARKILKALAE